MGYSALPGDSISHAFQYDGAGPIQDLNSLVDASLGWTLDAAVAINDKGQIAAEGYEQGGPEQALLLTPVPEPSSLSLFLLACAHRYRRQISSFFPSKFDRRDTHRNCYDFGSFLIQEVRSCLGFEVLPSFSPLASSRSRGGYTGVKRNDFCGGFGSRLPTVPAAWIAKTWLVKVTASCRDSLRRWYRPATSV